MEEKHPAYIVIRRDLSPHDLALAIIAAREAMEDDQSKEFRNERASLTIATAVGEQHLRLIVAEGVVREDYVAVGTDEDHDHLHVAIIGPSTAAGPLLIEALDD